MKNLAVKLIFILLISVCFSVCSAENTPEYQPRLFDTGRVHTIDVQISEADWEDLLSRPEDKEKYETNVMIDGEPIGQVAFSAKGNSSLSFVRYSGMSSRYSFKLNFGKYVKGQTWHGLDKLNLQNGIADASYMKEYLSYELFRRTGVPAPLCSYAFLTINGEPYGLYLMVEEADSSFIERALTGDGSLYKPQWAETPLDAERINALLNGASAHAKGGAGSELLYIDDQTESYPDIFENTVTKPDPESEERVIAALKSLNSRNDLETVLDMEEIIRYFAVHNFLMNYDSYTGPMLHNYYLYENGGRLQFLPWDYNLAFGAYSTDGVAIHVNDPGAVINQGIDTPLVSTDLSVRPMWSWIPSDPEYLARYHEQMGQMIREQFDSGDFLAEADRVYEMIRPYIEQDPTAFYTVQNTDRAYETLRELILLRAESVRRQLNGTLAPETEQQQPEDRVDASAIDMTALGSLIIKK